ncbi:MAG: hypothetical protein AUJ85_00575 [Elusimicrobia bacterium CG1_02_37_114]|nr:MAG: hypothetical protein AUJ85_00575 [Elusimicrobia bacterium CG1_02_37_114]PIV52462.1 MAG: beta-ketoacyl-[acyl-carrier-protein] synthase II [Elusimicrobia bacterium CG02_land_8_20_14_3_00_37_13]PIZ14336.1 MAG: beta-ketoacyl-[acyl-carrier-protein] synthase II [Elusimicrobia bacterium CG_4_10_14_0_8_um_filter_37_32]
MKPRVVVTGIGAISPNGIGKDAYWHALTSGISGIKKISTFDISQYPSKVAGEISDFNPANYMDRKMANRLSRFTQFALASTRMAVEDSALKINDSYRAGISLGTAIGGLEIAEKECCVFYTKGMDKISPFSVMSMNSNSAVGIIAIEFNINGINTTISTGCSAGLSAIAHAYDIISNGRADIMIAGGAEAPLFPVTFESFCASQVLSKRNGDPTKASRPFEKNRDGYILGEGAGIVILEKLDHALERKAKIYVEIAGYGVTNDSYSIFKMEPTGKNVSRTIKLCMEDAKVSPEEIDYINAHGSSSVVADKRETNAIKSTLGECAYRIPISSIKSMIGQSLSASASLQFITSVLAVDTNWLPPTINYEEQDPECDLDYIPNKARNSREINTALINSFGAGGNNISMAIRKYKDEKYYNGQVRNYLPYEYTQCAI